jgi:hypothetical protein
MDRVILSNERDRNTLRHLRSTVGDAAIIAAIEGGLNGRQPYVSNICKALKIEPPESVKYTAKADARENLARLKLLLKG